MSNTAGLEPSIVEIVERHFGLHGNGQGWYQGAVAYTSAAENDCWELAEQLLAQNAEYSRLFSTKYVAQLVKDILTDTVERGDTSNISAAVENLVSRLNSLDQRKRCYVPVSGLQFDGRLDIGPFWLQWMDGAQTEQAIRHVQKAIGRTTNPTKHKEIVKRQIRREINKTLRGRPCFVYEADGDTERLHDEAVANVSTLFDLLRYSVPADLNGRNKRMNIVIGYPVEGRPSTFNYYVVPLGKSDARYGGEWSPIHNLTVDDGQLQFMERIGVFKIADTLSRTKTEFQSDLLNAIHWYAESQIQLTVEHELLDLVIAAESVVAREPGNTHGRTDTMCEAVAVLLKTDPAGREELFDFMEATSNKRGTVVHEGMTGTGQNKRLRHVVQEFLAAAITRSNAFETRFEFLGWVKDQKTKLFDRAQKRRHTLHARTSVQTSAAEAR